MILSTSFKWNQIVFVCTYYCTLEWIFKVNLIYVLQTAWTLFFFSPVLYIKFSLVIYFIHSSIYMSIPISQFITFLSPLGVHMFVLYICVSTSASQIGSFVLFFWIPRMFINIWYLFFWLTSLCSSLVLHLFYRCLSKIFCVLGSRQDIGDSVFNGEQKMDLVPVLCH